MSKTTNRKKRHTLMHKLYIEGRIKVLKRYFATRIINNIEGGYLYGCHYAEPDCVSLTEYLSNPKINIYKRSA